MRNTAVSAPQKLSALPTASTGAWLKALTKASAKLAVNASDQPSLDCPLAERLRRIVTIWGTMPVTPISTASIEMEVMTSFICVKKEVGQCV